ncbi:MAG: kelch repeat-containing protein [Armatimonadota bacterium]
MTRVTVVLIVLAATAAAGAEVLTPMPEPLSSFGYATDGTFGYVVSGSTSGWAEERTQRAYRYDPATDSWDQIADVNTARYETSAAYAGGHVYLLGGQRARERDRRGCEHRALRRSDGRVGDDDPGRRAAGGHAYARILRGDGSGG